MSTEMKTKPTSIFAQLDVLTEQHTFPTIGPAAAITLGRALEEAKPNDLNGLGSLHLKEIVAETDHLTSLLHGQNGKNGHRRAAGDRFNAAWGAFHGLLDARARLPVDAAEVEEARAVREMLFDDGLGWLRSPQVAKWGVSSAKIARIESTPGLRKRVVALTSAVVLETVEEAHLELGEALGIGAKVPPKVEDMSEPLSRFRTAVADYVRVVIGTVDRRDAKTLARAEQALAPIARFRALINATRGNGGGAVEATPPIAEPPTSPATVPSPSPARAPAPSETPSPA